MNIYEPNEDNVDSDWKKIERDMLKIGQKNGLLDGRDLNFQNSFDKGYQEGFKNGFELGNLKFKSHINKNILTADAAEILENRNKAVCVICSTGKNNDNLTDIRNKQQEIFKNVLEKVEKELGLSGS